MAYVNMTLQDFQQKFATRQKCVFNESNTGLWRLCLRLHPDSYGMGYLT